MRSQPVAPRMRKFWPWKRQKTMVGSPAQAEVMINISGLSGQILTQSLSPETN